MTCGFNEWAAAPDSTKSGEHVSMLLDETSVCLSGPMSQLLLMRPRCHGDHTYCRLLLQSIPQTSRRRKNTHTYTHTHTHIYIYIDIHFWTDGHTRTRPDSISTQRSHCNWSAFSNSSYKLWRFHRPCQSAATWRKRGFRLWQRIHAPRGEGRGEEGGAEVNSHFLDLRFILEFKLN